MIDRAKSEARQADSDAAPPPEVTPPGPGY
jgi:hypothetical protein